MNQSKILTIEVLISIEWFTVQFETDSIERNRLMTVRYNGFLLDTAELPHTHPTYYKEMKKEMCKAAEAHWNSTNEESVSQQITGIPTLDYHREKLALAVQKTIAVLLIFLLPVFAKSQAYIDFGGGAAMSTRTSNSEAQDVSNAIVPVMKISAGYQFNNNIIAEGIIQPSLTRKINMPSFLGVKAGYNFNGFIPSVGYLYNYRNADDKSMNAWEAAYALKYQCLMGDMGGLYAEAMYTKSSYSFTAGFYVSF